MFPLSKQIGKRKGMWEKTDIFLFFSQRLKKNITVSLFS